jgi:hypothetical protein
MYYGSANLKSAVKRDVIIDGDFERTKSYIELQDFNRDSVGKPGVMKLTSCASLTSRKMIHVLYHPDLYEYGEVSAQQIHGPGEFQLKVTWRPHDKEFDVDGLEWFARIYVDDSILL